MKCLLNKVFILCRFGKFTLHGYKKCNVKDYDGKVKNFTVTDCKWKFLSITVTEMPFRLSLCRVKVYGTCESRY